MKLAKNSAFLIGAAVVLAGATTWRAATHRTAPASIEAEQISKAGARDDAIRARIAAKERISKDVIAGRTSLLQAAAAFRDLAAHGPIDPTRGAYPQAESEDEAYCRSVIEYVRGLAPAGADDDLICGLEAELYTHSHDGAAAFLPAQADSADRVADAASGGSPSSP